MGCKCEAREHVPDASSLNNELEMTVGKSTQELLPKIISYDHHAIDLKFIDLKQKDFDISRAMIDYLFIDIIKAMHRKNKNSNSQSKEDLIAFCKEEAEKIPNQQKIKYEFNQMRQDLINKSYLEKPIHWYSVFALVNDILNRYIGDGDYHKIFQMRFIINLLTHTLTFLPTETYTKLKICIGAWISKNEFPALQAIIGKPMLIKGIIFTTTSEKKVDAAFSEYKDKTSKYKLMFIIHIDDEQFINSFNFQLLENEDYVIILNPLVIINEIIFKAEDKIYLNCSLTDLFQSKHFFSPALFEFKEKFYKNLREEYLNDKFILNEFFFRLGKYDQCIQILNTIQIPDNNQELYSEKLNALGLIYNNTEEYGKAMEILFLSLKIKSTIHRENQNHIQIAECYENIGIVFNNQGDYAQALEYYHKSLKIKQNTLGERHFKTASAYNAIGMIFENKKDYDTALEHYSTALKIRISVLGDNHDDTAESFNNLAVVYHIKEEYDKALECYHSAMNIIMTNHGEVYPDLIKLFNNIGVLYDKKSDFEKALVYYNKALAIQLVTLEENHPDLAITYQNIGGLYSSNGDSIKALEYYQLAVGLRNLRNESNEGAALLENLIAEIHSNNARRSGRDCY